MGLFSIFSITPHPLPLVLSDRCYIADNCLAARMHMYMLDCDSLLAALTFMRGAGFICSRLLLKRCKTARSCADGSYAEAVCAAVRSAGSALSVSLVLRLDFVTELMHQF